MKTLLTLLLAAFCFAPCASAHADTYTIFNLNNVVLQSGAVATGTTTIDITTGKVTAEDVFLTKNSVSYEFDVVGTTVNTLHDTYWDVTDASGLDTFELSVPPLSLIGYLGGSVCNATENCLDENNTPTYILYHEGGFTPHNGSIDFIGTTGNLTPAPEPSSLVLLGTGAMGCLGAAYRRMRARL